MNIWLKPISLEDGQEYCNLFGLEKVILTSKNENIQSKRSISNISGELIGIHDGYIFTK